MNTYFGMILTKIRMCQQILVKNPKYEISGKSSQWSHAVHCRQTGMHFANAPVIALETSLVCSDTTKDMHQQGCGVVLTVNWVCKKIYN